MSFPFNGSLFWSPGYNSFTLEHGNQFPSEPPTPDAVEGEVSGIVDETDVL